LKLENKKKGKKMCFNAEASLSTFILGTGALAVGAMVNRKNKMFLGICGMWVFVMLIQLWEYLIWKNLPEKDGTCNQTNRFATKATFVTNVLTPVAVFAFLSISSKPDSFPQKVIGAVATLMYLAFVIYRTVEDPEMVPHCSGCNEKQCKSVDHVWWRKMSGFPYLLMIALQFLLFIRPWRFSLAVTGYTLITFLVALATWKNPEKISSKWCFLSSLAPIVFLACSKSPWFMKETPLWFMKEMKKTSMKKPLSQK
jgi:hypothetical protein